MAGCDAVKFQLVQPDRLVPDKAQTFTYERLLPDGTTESVTENYHELVSRRYLTFDDWRKVRAHCSDIGIAFFATATYPDTLQFLVDVSAKAVKVASGDINNVTWIRECARTGLQVHLDTGNATLGEVEAAVLACEEEGNGDIVIHHVPSGYPARLESVNLRMIPTLQAFGHTVGFSDHSPGWDMDIAAIALGASVIEKTLTLDRTQRGPEHMFSLEPDDMTRFVRAVRDVEVALGGPWRRVGPEQRESRKAARRSPVAVNGAVSGTRLAEVAVEWARPGTGLTPEEYERLKDARLLQPVAKGDKIGIHHVTG
jgi:sialic acid synthase SpsE